jgi:glycosyltransferase involved in cell wall biosynthesis
VLGDGPRPSGLAERLGVGERVRYMGYRPDIERYYQAADLLVLPTLYETFCKAAYEAAACELPVVAPRVGAVPELVGEREAGILVERTPASVAAALRELTADPALRARMGREGRRRSVSHTGERYVTSVLELYERLLADSPSAATAA